MAAGSITLIGVLAIASLDTTVDCLPFRCLHWYYFGDSIIAKDLQSVCWVAFGLSGYGCFNWKMAN